MLSDEDEAAGIYTFNKVVKGGETTRMAALIGHIYAFDESTTTMNNVDMLRGKEKLLYF